MVSMQIVSGLSSVGRGLVSFFQSCQTNRRTVTIFVRSRRLRVEAMTLSEAGAGSINGVGASSWTGQP